MNYKLLIRTLSYLRWTQIRYQLLYRIKPGRLKQTKAPIDDRSVQFPYFIRKSCCRHGEYFNYLNVRAPFISWNDTSHGMLWAYNLNYMDWLCQTGADYVEGAKWIDRFIDDLPNNKVGTAPYPIALRTINWVKFICCHRADISANTLQRWHDALISQYRLLEQRLEFHLLGNHLLEDAYALYMGAIYFADDRLFRRASDLMRKELDEQILEDGAHYEQSPMYHCILLDRLLDCYCFSCYNSHFDGQKEMNAFMKLKAGKMLGHLVHIVYTDGTIPLLNDASLGIAPSASQIFDYARQLEIPFEAIKSTVCGYRKWKIGSIEATIDVGNIMATYQPGHSHADTFNYELRIGVKPFIVDTGISTYDKTPRRQYERSTAAHNTVTIDGHDSSEVWGGFRVGRRATVTILSETNHHIVARHCGMAEGLWHQRTFDYQQGRFTVIDLIAEGHNGISFLHLAPEVTVKSTTSSKVQTSVADINIEGAEKVELLNDFCAVAYNTLQPIKVIAIHFQGTMTYTITEKQN